MRFRNYFQPTLLEALILEGKVEHIAKNQGSKIISRWKRDNSAPDALNERILEALETKDPHSVNPKRAPDAEEKAAIIILNWFSDHISKKYLQWVVNRYIAEDFLMEDAVRVGEVLEKLDKLASRLPVEQRDANKWKSLSDLEDKLEELEGTAKPLTKEETEEDKELIKKKEAIVFHDGDGFKVIIPKTKAAAINFGRGTKWCTSSNKEESTHFADYAKRGELYIVFTSDGNKYQFHFKDKMFMDEKDHAVKNWDTILKKYPKLKDVFNDQAEKVGFIPLIKHVTLTAVAALLKDSYIPIYEKSAQLSSLKPLSKEIKDFIISGPEMPNNHRRHEKSDLLELVFVALADQFSEEQLAKVLDGCIDELRGDSLAGFVNVLEKHPKLLNRLVHEILTKDKGHTVDYAHRRGLKTIIKGAFEGKQQKALDEISDDDVSDLINRVDDDMIEFFPNAPDKTKIEAIRKNHELIKKIKSPTPRMKEEARWSRTKKRDYKI